VGHLRILLEFGYRPNYQNVSGKIKKIVARISTTLWLKSVCGMPKVHSDIAVYYRLSIRKGLNVNRPIE